MVTAITLTLSMSLIREPLLPKELQDTKKFELLRASERVTGSRLTLERKADGAEIVIDFGVLRPNRRPFADRAIDAPVRTSTLDSYPLGAQCEIVSLNHAFLVTVLDANEIVRLSITSSKVPNEHGFTYRVAGFASEERWLVAATREAVARYASRRAGNLGTTDIRGVPVKTFVAQQSGETYFNLTEYVDVLGDALTTNLDEKRFAFTHRGTLYVFLLGSSKAKIGGAWESMGDTPMLVDEDVYIPGTHLPRP